MSVAAATTESGKETGGGKSDQRPTEPSTESGGGADSAAKATAAAGVAVEGEREGARTGDDADGPGRVGAAVSRPLSRGSSFDSVGDVVVVGGLALGNHRGFPGEDKDWWSQSQPGPPSSPQVGD